jgi:alkanesulfonate monooxygenase SsuD/methylene tetrahydromethanopterin reductase-like flavin-dependent oxidoreductase (luciferase family)
VILQFAEPALISWCLGFVREGARQAGRDFAKLEILAAAAAWIPDDLSAARDRVRWFPALVFNHVIDMIAKYGTENLPPALTAYVRDRPGYDYLQHCEVDSSNRNFVSDEVVDRFCLVGPAAAHRDKLAELASLVRGRPFDQTLALHRHLSGRSAKRCPGAMSRQQLLTGKLTNTSDG